MSLTRRATRLSLRMLRLSRSYGRFQATGAPLQNFSMSWSPRRQTVSCDSDVFTHRGPTSTDPSHDLAHLLIAASGNLPWKPGGIGKKAKLAEYNAFLIENILDMTYNCIAYKTIHVDKILPQALSRAKWFVEEHYLPFPGSAQEAFVEFRNKLDVAPIVRLSPHFLRQKSFERNNPNFAKLTYHISFKKEESTPEDQTSIAFRKVVSEIMSGIKLCNYSEFRFENRLNSAHSRNGCRFCHAATSFVKLLQSIFSYTRERLQQHRIFHPIIIGSWRKHSGGRRP
jgi:hypothetical protein